MSADLRGAPSEDARDGGVATVLAAVMCLSLVAVLWLGVQVGMAVVARNRAEGAADLGALAAATLAPQGTDAACARAEWVARSMRTVILSCSLDGWSARLDVRTEDSGWLADLLALGHARAGPADGATGVATEYDNPGVTRTCHGIPADLPGVAVENREQTVRQDDLSDGLSPMCTFVEAR